MRGGGEKWTVGWLTPCCRVLCLGHEGHQMPVIPVTTRAHGHLAYLCPRTYQVPTASVIADEHRHGERCDTVVGSVDGGHTPVSLGIAEG